MCQTEIILGRFCPVRNDFSGVPIVSENRVPFFFFLLTATESRMTYGPQKRRKSEVSFIYSIQERKRKGREGKKIYSFVFESLQSTERGLVCRSFTDSTLDYGGNFGEDDRVPRTVLCLRFRKKKTLPLKSPFSKPKRSVPWI